MTRSWTRRTTLGLLAGGASTLFVPAIRAADGFDHGLFDAVLRRVVDDRGFVRYGSLSGDADLRRYIDLLGAVLPEEAARWPREAQLAFWSNAYNALTLHLIVESGFPASIRDITPDPWEQVRWTVAGRKVSLNFIEHTKLRRTLAEPRVHFVLVCAARSCPVLPNRALTAEGLETSLNQAMKAFLTDRQRNRIDPGASRVVLNPILQWYGGDFVSWPAVPAGPAFPGRTAAEAAVLRLLFSFATEAERTFLGAGRFALQWADYDWRLNRAE